MAIDGVIGTAVGRGNGGGHVVHALTTDAGVRGIPATVGGVIVRPYVTGEIFAQPRPGSGGGGVDRTSRFTRPVPIGVSTGHPDITAGTIGARLTDGVGNVYALSNNHVYADVNKGLLPDSSTYFDGDAVIQPGDADDGTSPADDIGNLVAFEFIDFTTGVANRIDAAIASTTVNDLGNSTPLGEGYGTPSSTIIDAFVGQNVTKYGRTTGSTDGKVDAINASVNVNYGEGNGVAFFTGQVVIKGKKGVAFSAGGDSGSLIVSNDGSYPVALLFAGSTTTTIGSPIDEVLGAFSSFGVSIDGDTSSPPAPTPTPSPSGGEMTVESIDVSGVGGKNSDKDVRVTV